MKNLLITGAAHPDTALAERLSRLGWCITIHQQESDPIEHPERYDAVVCNGLFLHHPIETFTRLRTIQLTSAGLDRVPLEYIQEKGIKLYNARGVYSIPMAEWTVCAILDIYKDTDTFRANQARRNWCKNRNLRELCHKRAAIIGAGNVGSEIARRLRAFGTDITGYDLHPHPDCNFDCIVSIDEFQPEAYDILILTAPHTAQTHHFINADVLKRLKPHSILINLSRGGLIDETALTATLSQRQDITAVLDVFEHEPLAEDSPLWNMPNVRIYPHNSFVGEHNTERLHRLIVENLTNEEKKP